MVKLKKGSIMMQNFKTSTYRTNDMLHLRLSGDFDEDSATKLMNVLKKNSLGLDGIYIDASNVSRVHPYGQNIIREGLTWIKNIEPYVLISGGNLGQGYE